MLVTLERSVEADVGGYDSLYGLPFPFISSNYAFTHHYDVYMLMMVIDLLLYFGATLLLYNFFERHVTKLKTHWLFISIGVIISIACICLFYVITFESTFKFLNEFDLKITGMHFYYGLYPR